MLLYVHSVMCSWRMEIIFVHGYVEDGGICMILGGVVNRTFI